MYHLSRFPKRGMAALSAMVALAALSGCQNHKIIARVNGAAINDEEYDPAVSRVNEPELHGLAQLGVQTDAGGAGLAILIKEKLLDALAKEKNAAPSEDSVNRFVQYLTRTNPAVSTAIETGQINKEDLPRLIREQLIQVALGSNNAIVPEEDLKKEFEANKALYNYPEIVGLKAVPVPSATEGIQLINQIKATGDFAGAAAKLNPQAAQQAGKTAYITTDKMPPALKTAIDALKEGQIAPAPIELPNQQGGPSTNIVVQLVRRMPKGDAAFADAREAVRQRKLQQTQPQLMQHSQEVINEYNQKANVEVFIDRYKAVVKAALTPPPAPPMGMGAPGMSGQPPTAPAPGGQPMPGARRVTLPQGAGAPTSAPDAKAGATGAAAPTKTTGTAPASKP